jgi:cohesin complex subunit SA-1/2
MGAKNIDTVANAWLEKYTTNESEAIKDMINFIIKACGCRSFVTNYDAEDTDSAAATLTQIQEQFQRVRSPYSPIHP